MSVSGLELPGSLSLTLNATTDVGSTMENIGIHLIEQDTTRSTSYTPTAVNYYIQVTHNLNQYVKYWPSTANTTDNALTISNGSDDVYSFDGCTINTGALCSDTKFGLALPSNVSVKLPTAASVLVAAGMIDATAINSTTVEFPVQLTINTSDQGIMTASIAVLPSIGTEGASIVRSVADQSLKAQVAYWEVTVTTPPLTGYTPRSVRTLTGTSPALFTKATRVLNYDVLQLLPTDSDILAEVLTVAELNDRFFAAPLAVIKAFYHNFNMLASATIVIDAMLKTADNAVNNAISTYARNKNLTDIGTATAPTIFATGEKIVAATSTTYAISINDYNGTATDIISAANTNYIYGVLCQS